MKTMGGAFSTLVMMLLGMAFAIPVYSQEAVKNTASAAVESKETVATTSAVKKMLDLKTRTEVTKKLDRTEDTATGKIYHYLYRVQARPTATDTPRYLIDPSFSVSYAKKDFQANDTMSLISDNEETGTDSPIWVYEVAYVGAGARTLEFTTAGEVEVANYDAVSGEVVPADHCAVCGHSDPSQCTEACLCCCFDTHTHCDCIGCQLQIPRCFSCPVGCTCSHCVCSCDGCLNQNPACHSCPPDCDCSHCQCLCESNVDHEGICGCRECKYGECSCECHNDCP